MSERTHLVIPNPPFLLIMHLQRAITITPSTAPPQLPRLLLMLTLPIVLLIFSYLLTNLLFFITINKSIFPRHSLHLSITEERHIEARFGVGDLLEIAFGEDEVDSSSERFLASG